MADNNLEIWEELFQNNEWGKYPALGVVKFIARNFYKSSDRSQIKVLEIGAGTGANLWFVAREGFSVYAIEGSETAINSSKERLNAEGLSDRVKDFYAGDYLYELNNFDDSFFDAVIDVESLCCNTYDKSKDIIDLVYEKLKPGGVFYSQTFNKGTWGLEGSEIDFHAVKPKTGPMSGMGLIRYTTKEDVQSLYVRSDVTIQTMDCLELLSHQNTKLSEWIIELKKNN